MGLVVRWGPDQPYALGGVPLPKFAANLSLLFTEMPFLDRFEAAARAGFRGVEFLFPYDFEPAAILERLEAYELEQALFNFPCGDWENGERGFAALAGREAEFHASVARGINYARAIGAPRLHLMAGIVPAGTTRESAAAVYTENVATAAHACAQHGIEVMLEPLNAIDVPGYFLRTIAQALEIIDRVNAPNVRLQLDLYHTQISEGDLARKITDLAGRYTHVQIAGNPGRHEPDDGELNYPYLLETLDATGYDGWVGCEYRPRAGTRAGLGWAAQYGISLF